MTHYFERLEQSISKNWDRPALSDFGGDTFTFADFATNIEKTGILLEVLGVKKGDKVAICARNSAHWAMSFFSINTFEAVVVPILADFSPESINALVDHSDSVVLFTDNDILRKLDTGKMPQLKAIVSTADTSVLWASVPSLLEAPDAASKLFAERHREGFSSKDVNYPKDNLKKLALINYTSGTTSVPKGVMIRYESLCSNVDYGHYFLPTREGDCEVSMLPMAHMYGLMFELMYPLCDGVHITFLGKAPNPKTVMASFKKVHPYLIMTVPLVIEKIFKNGVIPLVRKPLLRMLFTLPISRGILNEVFHRKLMKAFGGKVRFIVMGGAPLSADVEKYLKQFRLPYSVGYGMTEAAPLLAHSYWKGFAMRSCGKAVLNMELRVDSEDPQNVPGELQGRGVNVMEGYYKNPEATEAAFTEDGWLKTGDLGIIDAAGNVFIKGRSKNMILSSNGQNIYPEELEALVNARPYVLESVVVERYPTLVALVYLDKMALQRDGMDIEGIHTLLDISLTAVNRKLPSYSKISKFEIVDAPFAKTPKMSIKRYLYK